MNKLLAVLGLIGAILGVVFAFLPISNLAVIPASIGLFLGLIAFLRSKKEGKTSFPRVVMLIALLAIIVSVGKQLIFTDEVKEDTEFIEKTDKSKEDAVKEIEELEDELEDELEELE